MAKFDKARTVLLLPEAAKAVRSMPRSSTNLNVFTSKRGRKLTNTSHYAIWNPVRAAFWASLSEERRRQVVDLDWHSLRHFTGHHFYITLGYGSELAAYQLGHADPSLIEKRYGKPYQGALERLKLGARRLVVLGPSRRLDPPSGDGRSSRSAIAHSRVAKAPATRPRRSLGP